MIQLTSDQWVLRRAYSFSFNLHHISRGFGSSVLSDKEKNSVWGLGNTSQLRRNRFLQRRPQDHCADFLSTFSNSEEMGDRRSTKDLQ